MTNETEVVIGVEPEPQLNKMPVTIYKDGAFTLYTLKPASWAGGRYELETDPEYSDLISGIIGISYDGWWNLADLDCSECPVLQRGEISQWTVQLNPDGYSRRRIDSETRIALESDALRYKPAYRSKRTSARNNKYKRWLGETRRDRFQGFYKG